MTRFTTLLAGIGAGSLGVASIGAAPAAPKKLTGAVGPSDRDGELCLGTWQRVLFLELDRERDRRWLVQVVGT